MGQFARFLLAGFLLLLGFAFPSLLLWWWGTDALHRHRVAHSPAYPAVVRQKNKEWGGRAFGLEHFARVEFTPALPYPSAPRQVQVKVTENEYEALRPGQRTAVKYNAATSPRALLATSRWWTWTHAWWLAAGLFLLGYYLKLVRSLFRPRPESPAA